MAKRERRELDRDALGVRDLRACIAAGRSAPAMLCGRSAPPDFELLPHSEHWGPRDGARRASSRDGNGKGAMTALRYGDCYAAFYGGRPPVEVPFLTRLARSFDLTGDLRVLDLGCGTGRLLGPLAALGWRVVGMDPQLDNLGEARRVAANTPGVAEIVVGGFGDLDAVEAFDMIVAVGDPWWYLLTAAARADALLRVCRALRPQGVVVLEGPNFEWILNHYREPQPTEADVNGIRVRRVPRHQIDRVAGTWTHTDPFTTLGNGDELTMVHRFAIIPITEVRSALAHAGFDPVELYPNWASTAPGEPDGPRIIAVGRRPA